MSQASLERAIPAGDRILLDTSTLIAYLNRDELVFPLAAHVVDNFISTSRNAAIVSMVTAMEVLVRPLRFGLSDDYRHLVDFLTRFPNLRAAVVDLVVAQEAASLRGTHRLSTADALVVATGVTSQVGHLVTNDRNWLPKLQPLASQLRVCYLSNHLPFP